MSIATRFAFVFLFAVGLVAAAFYLILDRVYLHQLENQAETVADNVDAFGTWVAQYGRVWKARDGTDHGFGFKEGDVAGIISVRLPAPPFWTVALGILGGWQLLMIGGAFLIAMLFVRFAIVAPVKRLTRATHQISPAQPADLGVTAVGRGSRNELHQLAIAIDRLRRSIHIAMRKLGDAPPVAAGAPERHGR